MPAAFEEVGLTDILNSGRSQLRTGPCAAGFKQVVPTPCRLSGYEAMIRSLGAEIRLRPIVHTRAGRIRAYRFLSALA